MIPFRFLPQLALTNTPDYGNVFSFTDAEGKDGEIMESVISLAQERNIKVKKKKPQERITNSANLPFTHTFLGVIHVYYSITTYRSSLFYGFQYRLE